MRGVALGLGAVLIATAAWAHQGVKDPDVQARMHLMMQVKGAMGSLGKMANGAEPFDASRAAAAKAELARYAGQILNAFEKPATDPKSEALSTIWVSFPDFAQRAVNMNAAFLALDTSSLEALRAGLADAGGTCTSCHKSYRMETN